MMYSVGKLIHIARDGENKLGIGLLRNNRDSVEEMNESLIIAAADFKCCVDKNVGNVVVCGAYTAHEGVKLIKAVDSVNVGVYKTYAVAYIKGQLLLLFDADNIAGTGGCSLIYPVNKLLGFSCTFAADYK